MKKIDKPKMAFANELIKIHVAERTKSFTFSKKPYANHQ
jgi:hypothetical protein